MALFAQMQAERLDKGAFACARHAGNADPDRIAGVGDELAQHFLAQVEMGLGVAFDQSNGLSDDIAVAGQHPGDVFIDAEAFAARDTGA